MLIKLNDLFLKFRNSTVGRFSRENKGAAAIEFALIAPLLLTLYLGTMEISRGLQVNKKVGRAASTMGDLVAQLSSGDNATTTSLDAILKIGKATLQPYNLSTPTIIVSGISMDSAGVPTVAWSRQLVGTTYTRPYAINSPATSPAIPTKLKIASTFLIRVQVKLEYVSITGWSLTKNKVDSGGKSYAAIDMSEIYYFKPRVDDSLSCAAC